MRWMGLGAEGRMLLQERVRGPPGNPPDRCPLAEMAERKYGCWDFPGGAVVKNPPANAGDAGSSPGPGRSHKPWSN